MVQSVLVDIAPEPAVLLVMGFILLLAAGLVVVLWYRKRSMRGVEMIRPDTLPTAPRAQANNPNQP